MSISIDVPFIPSNEALPQVSPTDYISALKSEASLPLLIRKKLGSIVQDYYKLSPQLAKKDNQMKIMYKYNQKLLQTIQSFIPHEKKIIQRYNGLMKLYLTSMKKYLTTLNWKVDFIENYPPIQSHFDNFSTKDWTFVIEEDPQYTVLKPYEQMLLDTIKRFFLVDKGTLMKQLERYISSRPATEDKQKIAAIDDIKQRIRQLDKDTVTTKNMFDMLHKRKEIELDIRDLDQGYFCEFIQKDKNFIDEIARIHTRLLTTNPKELKNYLQIESDVWRGLKKKSREYRKVLEDFCEKIESQNNDIKEQLQGLQAKFTKVENQRNEFSSKLQYMQLKQGSSTKKDKTANNTSIIEESIKASDVGGNNGMKEINKKLELRINELENEIKQMKIHMEERQQAHRNLNVKKELMNSNTQMEELRLKLCSKLMELGIEDTAAMTSGEMFDRILQNVGAVRHYQNNNMNSGPDYIDIKITDSIAMESVRRTPQRMRQSTPTIKEQMQQSDKLSLNLKKRNSRQNRQYIRDMPLVQQVDILDDFNVQKQEINRRYTNSFKQQKGEGNFRRQTPKYEYSQGERERQRQRQRESRQYDSRRQQKGSETFRQRDQTNVSRQGEHTQLSKKNTFSREDINQLTKSKEEQERRIMMQSERLEKVVASDIKQSKQLRESAPVTEESRLKKKNPLQMLPHSDLLSISQRKSVDEQSKMNDFSKTAKQLSINNEKGSMLIKEDIDYLKNINRLKEENYLLSKELLDMKDQIRRLLQKISQKDRQLQKMQKMPKSLLSSLQIEGKVSNVQHTHQIENLCQSLARELCRFEGNDFERMVINMQSAIKNIKSSSSQNPISDRANINQIPVLSKMLAQHQQNLFKSQTLMQGLFGGKLNREEDSKARKSRYSSYLDKSDRLSLKTGEVQIKYEKSIYFGNKDPHQPQSSSQLNGYPRTLVVGAEKSNNQKEESSDMKLDQDEMIDMVNNFQGMSRKKQKAKERENISDNSLKLSQSNIRNQFSIKESELREIKEQIKPSDRKLMHDMDYLKRLELKLEEIKNQYDAGNDLYWFHKKYKQTLQALERTEEVVRAHEKRRQNCTNKLKAGDSSLSRHKLEENIYFLQQKVNTLESQLENHRNEFENQMASDFQQIDHLKSIAMADIVKGIFKNYINVP